MTGSSRELAIEELQMINSEKLSREWSFLDFFVLDNVRGTLGGSPSSSLVRNKNSGGSLRFVMNFGKFQSYQINFLKQLSIK